MRTKSFSICAAALSLCLVIFHNAGQVLAQQGRYSDWHMGPGMMGGYGILGWFGGILGLVIWILIIVGLIYLIRWLIQNTKTQSGTAAGNSTKAMDILRERYARGEIDRQEFEAKKKDLTS